MTYQTAVHLFAFLGLDLPQVELELLALQDVAVCSAALAGSGGDASCMKEDGSRVSHVIKVSTSSFRCVGLMLQKYI